MAKPVKWILIVDDEIDLRELISGILEFQFGDKLKIVTAADGVEATSKIRFQAYDCILTDLQMPKREGRAFVEAVNQSALNQHTPVIVHTGFPDKDLVARFPMCTLLEKPAPSEKVIQLIETQLKLGKTDRRIGAHVLNTLVDVTLMLLKKMIKAGDQVNAPHVKRKGDRLACEFLRLVTIKIGTSTADFSFGFPEALLAELDKVVTHSEGGHDLEKVMVAATTTILNSALRLLDGGHASLVRSQILWGERNRKELDELFDRKGIMIPVATPFGTIELFAIS